MEASTKVIIGPARASYAQVWEPKAMDDKSEPKYSISLLIPKKEKALIKKIEAAILAAYEKGKTKDLGGMSFARCQKPMKDGDLPDDEGKIDPNYKGMMVVRASSKTPPGIVDEDINKILDRREFYSGCWCFASVNFYTYSKGKKGIAGGLGNLQKAKDDEPFGGGSTPEEDFKPLKPDTETDGEDMDEDDDDNYKW